MSSIAIGLVPVFNENTEGATNLRLSDLNTRDITLDSFIKYFFDFIPGYINWKWSNADRQCLNRYTRLTLETFCDDHDKIVQTQKMIKLMMYEKDFMSFILHGYDVYESFYDRGDFTYRLSTCYEKFVIDLVQRFSKLHQISQKNLMPFISHFQSIKQSELFLQIQEFNKLFEMPMRFTGYLGRDHRTNKSAGGLIKEKYYSEDSRLVSEILDSTIEIHDVSCVFLTEHGELSANSLPVLEIEQTVGLRLSKIKYRHMIEILKVSLQDFVHEVFPDTADPLKITIVVGKNGDKQEIAITLSEPEDGSYLSLVDDRKKPSYYVLAKDSLNEVLLRDKPNRTGLQKKLINITNKVSGSSVITSLIYDIKTSYFYSSFFRKCQEEVDSFGKALVELRYIAFVAQQFCSVGKLSDIVFPTALSKEDNKTLLARAKNPTLIFENYEKGLQVIPNDICIDEKNRVQTITGPNQNGKSRYIDTISISQIIFQMGWPVFAKEATMSPKTDLRVHYVHSGVGITGESRFSHECQRMRKVFAEMSGTYPLIMIDEPYTGTNHGDGETLLAELLQACSKENISVFLTTHFHGLIPIVNELVNGKNLHCYVDDDGLFTYQIRDGSSTKSNALDVARNAGVRFDQLVEIIQLIKNPPPKVVISDDGLPEEDLPF